jgi:hypothetical protein
MATSKLVLPNGRSISIIRTDPQRPWEAYDVGGGYVVRRARRGADGEFEFLKYRADRPYVFDRAEALYVVGKVNLCTDGRFSAATPRRTTSLGEPPGRHFKASESQKSRDPGAESAGQPCNRKAAGLA